MMYFRLLNHYMKIQCCKDDFQSLNPFRDAILVEKGSSPNLKSRRDDTTKGCNGECQSFNPFRDAILVET